MEYESNLLSPPTVSAEKFVKTFKRKICKYKDESERFKVKERVYDKQYSNIYFVRLTEMGRRVVEAAEKKWGMKCEESLADLSKRNGQECFIVGTIFKQMDLKPSILKEISAKNHLIPQPARVKYVSATDKLILEDRMQRVMLSWEHTEDSPADGLVTGVVVGLRGREKKKGEFEVIDVCYPQPPLSKDLPELNDNEDRYVLLTSGLNLGSSWCDQLSVELMVDYITGQLSGIQDQVISSSIVRVIIAGNSITDKPVKSSDVIGNNQLLFQTRNYSADSLGAMKELDVVLTQLSSCVPVDLMAGLNDPTNYQLPQQPMHRCMFPQASQNRNLQSVTNPYAATIDGISFLGCSGQNVNNIYQFTTMNDRMNILENTFHWSHIVPTAPDTLACFPFLQEDPFIIKECPHVYFAGNQPHFQKKHIQTLDRNRVLLICVPNFDLTHSCVLVNLNSLDCREIRFATSLAMTHNPALQRQREIEADLKGEALLLSQPPPEVGMSLLHHMEEEDDNFDD